VSFDGKQRLELLGGDSIRVRLGFHSVSFCQNGLVSVMATGPASGKASCIRFDEDPLRIEGQLLIFVCPMLPGVKFPEF
jgi:hypothetical protein